MRNIGLGTLSLLWALALVTASPAHAAGGGEQFTPPAHAELTADGPVFVTPQGMTLYFDRADDSTPGKSQCTDVIQRETRDVLEGVGKIRVTGYQFLKSCVQIWPPYLADGSVKPTGDWSTIERPDGAKQWAFRGKLLYTSVRDGKPGDRNGVVENESAAGGGGGARGFQLAKPPIDLPGALRLVRVGEDLVLAARDGTPVYTPRDGRPQTVALSAGDQFEPVRTAFAGTRADYGADWSVVNAGDGRPQFAFKGHALFFAPPGMTVRDIDDTKAWDQVVFKEGDGLPPQIKTHVTLVGDVYTDAAGSTLYLFTCAGAGCDMPGGAAAYWAAMCGEAKECSRRWHPYAAGPDARPSGDWSIVDVADPLYTDPAGVIYPPDVPRVKAWAYRGRPVYTYYRDKAPGDIVGHMVRWFGQTEFDAVEVAGRGLGE